MPLSPDARAWLHFRHLPGVGPRLLSRVMDRFPSSGEALAADPESLRAIGLPEPALAARKANRGSPREDTDCHWLQQDHHHLLARNQPGYPELLVQIPDAPPLLYVEGHPAALDRGPLIAVVGTRRPTRSGQENARSFARDLAASGFTVVSGLARGIDGAAHRGALEANGTTVAVQGCGPDRIYPAEHSSLAQEIAGSGALVSEFPTGVPPQGPNFPQRNRIISGLSLGVLVVEAGPRSGALTTARWAGRQGREVWAIPGPIQSPLSRGPHRLIREGAKLVETLVDIAEELPQSGPSQLGLASSPRETEPPDAGLTSDQQAVLQAVELQATAPEQVAARSGLTPHRVSGILLELEIRGLVASEPGGFFTRLAEACSPEGGSRRS